MDVTYKEIVEGYILKKGDTLVIHGIEYIVEQSVSYPYYFLREKNHKRNDLVFDRLGIKDKQDYCERIVGKESVISGIFPEIDTLDNLTRVVKALYKQSPYKVGDKVKLVSDLKGLLWVIEGMLKYAGQIVTIENIETKDFSDRLNGDPHDYVLCGGYIWPPQAIECKITTEPEESEDETSEESQPKTVSRIDLERGYILKEDDVIYIGDIKHRVHPHYFLTTPNPPFGRIFEILGLTQKEKDTWAAAFGCKCPGCDFPQFDTFEDLTKFVLDIFRKYDEFEKAKSSPVAVCIKNAVCNYCDIDYVHYHKIREDVRSNCYFNDDPIIINTSKSKTKTTIKL